MAIHLLQVVVDGALVGLTRIEYDILAALVTQQRTVVPRRLLIEADVPAVSLPGLDGELGILPGHAAMLSELGSGELKVTTAGKTESFGITGGYVEVRDNVVRVLADSVS